MFTEGLKWKLFQACLCVNLTHERVEGQGGVWQILVVLFGVPNRLLDHGIAQVRRTLICLLLPLHLFRCLLRLFG
eukprot:5427359-Prymnesium_polylepis.2